MVNGINWEARTGKPLDKITIDDKLTVIVSILDNLTESVKTVKPLCDQVRRHTDYFKIIVWISSFIGASLITWLVTKVLGLIH